MPGGPLVVSDGVGGPAQPKNTLAGIFMVAFSAFGGILFGYDTGVIAGVKEMKDWLRTFGHPDPQAPSGYAISSSTESLVVSILSAGTFFGALLAAPMADYMGRKWGIVFACLIFCAGVAMQTAAAEIAIFVIGRVFAGLGVGLISCLVPMYQSECSPKWIRGSIVSTYQMAITIGLLIASVINNATQDRDDHSAYRIPTAIQFIWGGVLASGVSLLPESPRWLVKRRRDADAALALQRLIGCTLDDPEIEEQLNEIRVNLLEEIALGESSYLDCFRSTKNRIALRTMTGILVQAWQQLTGINFIFYYGTTFFKNSGITDPFLISVATTIVNVFMTLPGIWGVERYGRRTLLLVGAAGMCICEFIIAIVGVTISVNNIAGQKVLIAITCVYIAFFASTWGPIPWVLTSEIFPLQVRAKAMSLSIASNWLWNFALSYSTPYLVNKQRGSAGLQAKVFFIWGSTCFCCLIFTYFCIPETKGLSLEQIDRMYTETTPLKSHVYRRRFKAGVTAHETTPADHLTADEKT